MKKTYFAAQLENGQTLESEIFGLTSIRRATDRNNRTYLDLELVDKTGSIKAKVWSDYLDKIEQSALHEGTPISVNAQVSQFNGQNQLTIYSISQVEDFDISDFLLTTDKDIEELYDKVLKKIKKVQDNGIKKILDKLFKTYSDEIKKSPAASSIHHNFVGGLLEHINEMLEISDSVTKLYPEADPDLVTAGIIFHDIGKIKELAIDGFQIKYTAVGKLIGHISLGLEMLNNLDTGILDEEKRLQLSHIILSHHYVLEFGSPVTPRTIEAVIVAKIDDLSSKTRLVQKILANNSDSDQEFAPREFGIDGEVYLGKK